MKQKRSVLRNSIITGFVGGVIFSLLNSFTYALKFTDVSHASFIVRSFFQGSWTSTWWIEIINAFMIGLLAVIPAIVYYLTLKQLRGMMPGFLYGIVLWGLIFWLANPLFETVPSLGSLNSETIVTTLCQFVLYGVFVGYTLSYESHDERIARKV
ncbi:hypothetical protein ABID56_002424 [Alkalibacillus flavidus]|uniref:Uncharacterized protein n=1 Tax=Alkalibacillus flavidus TaxID=546021 RepID=A0ABV2KXJ6_9BACI